MSKSNKAAKSALLLIIFTMGSKVLGFLREMLIANKFGSGMKTDTFFIALSAATLIGEFLRSSVSTTFIPVIEYVGKFAPPESLFLSHPNRNFLSHRNRH